MRKNISFMAFAKGKESAEESAGVKRYIGVAPVTLVSINPTKEELETLYNGPVKNDPIYLSDKDGVKNLRVEFYVKTVADRCNGIETISKVSYFMQNAYRYNKDKTKVQVIDKYGRTAWVTEEEAKTHSTYLTKNDGSKYQANIDSDYRPAYIGEDAITDFIKVYLSITNPQAYIDGAWVPNPKVKDFSECEARLDESSIKEMFAGNFASIKEVNTYQPNNVVKVLFGVKTTDDGKQYQDVFIDKILSNGTTDYSKLDSLLAERKAAGAYSKTEFKVCPIEEYVVKPTDFNIAPSEDMPAGGDWFHN